MSQRDTHRARAARALDEGECAAGAASQPCYCLIGVATLDTAIQSMRAH